MTSFMAQANGGDNSAEQKSERPPVFKYPKIPRIESAIYLLILVVSFTLSIKNVYDVSKVFLRTDLSTYVWPSDWSFFGGHKDYSNWEWKNWLPLLARSIPWMIGHSALFNHTEALLGRLWSPVMLIYWIFSTCIILSPQHVIALILQGLFVYVNTRLFPHWASVWASGLFNLMTYQAYGRIYGRRIGIPEIDLLSEFMFVTYKQLQYISYNIYYLDQPKEKRSGFLQGIYDMLWYVFYLPYSITIIRIYRKFVDEVKTRHGPQRRTTRSIVFFGSRVFGYVIFLEFIRHHLYFDAMMMDPQFLEKIPLITMLGVGHTAGIFFQWKYFCMFGYHIFFARLDNMDPPDPPICITRLSLYSKMWRTFDRGLYDFFKEHIFVPVARPTFSLPRKFLGLVISYSFVAIWHAAEYYVIVWIVLNVAEIMLENITKSFYAAYFKSWRERNISDGVLRRFLCVIQVAPWSMATYGTFYFLGKAKTGYLFVERLFWGETVRVTPTLIRLVALGYCFCNAAIDSEMWIESKAEKEKEAKDLVNGKKLN